MSVRSPLPTGRCANSAQFCVACKRLYVHGDIYDDLARELVEVAKMVTVGNELEGAEMGPIQNRMQYDKVRDLLDDCRDTGQTFLLGGEVSGEPGYMRVHDVVVSALPCSHVYGNIVLNAGIAQGYMLSLHGLFDVDRILDSIETHRATMSEGVPAMYHYLLASPRLRQADLRSLTRCTVGGTISGEVYDVADRRVQVEIGGFEDQLCTVECDGEAAVGIFECCNPFLYRMYEAGLPGYAFLTED